MMDMRKFYYLQIEKILSVLWMVVLLCGCSQNNKERYTIGFSQCTGDDEWRKAMLDDMKRELAFYSDTRLIFKDANANSNTQIKQIRELLNNGIDLLIVSPNEAEPVTPVIEEAFKKGIPVVVVDRRTSSSYYTAYVGGDNYQVGKAAGQYIAALLNKKGKIIEITGLPKSSPANDRHRGLKEAIKPYPEITLVETLNGEWEKKQAKEQLSKVIHLYPDLDLIFAQNEVMALGAHEVCMQQFPGRQIKIVGVDGLPGAFGDIQMVYDKLITATALYPTGGEEAVRVAMNILRKQPFQRENLLQTAIIDSSNVRMIKMQTDKLLDQQKDIERQQSRIDEQLRIYKTQKVLLYLMTGLLVTAIILGSIALYSLVENKKINKELKAQSDEILRQRNQIQEIAEKAQEATESKFRFFTNISHEFRTPLTLIIGPVEDLLNQRKDENQVRKNLVLIQRNAQRLLRLVNQLMDFRKVESGKIRIQARLIDLNSFLKDIMEPFEFTAKRRKIDFRLISRFSALEVWFDEDMLDKVLFNLLSNAFKYTEDHGRIYLFLEQTPGFVLIKVEDNGSGMSESDALRAFEMFYQGGNAVRGTGLGLPLSRELVELHQGTIDVKSKLNEGTIFTVSIPSGKDHLNPEDIVIEDHGLRLGYINKPIIDTEDSAGVSFGKLAGAEAPSVLIIEDDDDLRGFLYELLKGKFQIIMASDGRSGLEKCFDTAPDLVVCDIMLPEMDGLKITSTLKGDLRTSHIPVMLLTAKNSVEQQVEGMHTGADLYLTKPFSSQLLIESISSLLINRKILRSWNVSNAPSENPGNLSRLDKKFLNDLKAAILSGISDPDLSVEALGRELGLSRVQLFRKAKALLGCGINEVILNMRLEKACVLLNDSELSIAEVADRVGFATQSYFSTVFKAKYGTSPKDFKGSVR